MASMGKDTINFTLDGEDAKLIQRLKKVLLPTLGKVSNTAVVRMALRKMEQENKPNG